ncbi:hypothetical protein [Nocardia takedensis]|uniref:hypothetical protein n=1 Tax=Nocardia takedensis TaxID=259390 RepID=UPI0002F2ACBC|nr:hypothetical protein [Nocardia takedensis]
MLVTDIDPHLLLARYLDVSRREHLDVLLSLVEQPDRPRTVDQLAADLEARPDTVAVWCGELSAHLISHHQWKATGKQLSTHLTANELTLIEEFRAHGREFVSVELNFYRRRTLRFLLTTGYLRERTLYTLEPATLARLEGLTSP